MIDSREIEIGSLLGQGDGGTGKVFLAAHKGMEVVVKQLAIIDYENCRRLRGECFLCKEMNHPNVIKLIGVCWDDMMLACVMEFMDGGSVETRLRKDWTLDAKEKMTWKGVLLKWAKEIAEGVQVRA